MKRRHGGQLAREPQVLLPSRVPEVVRALARWAVLSSAAAATCSAAGSLGAPPWQPVTCSDRNEPRVLEGVRLRRPHDYLGIYGQGSLRPGHHPVHSSERTAQGTACAGAPAATAAAQRCQAELAEASFPDASCEHDGRCPNFMIATAGDEVTRSHDRKDLLAVLGKIDDVHEALALALFDGYAIRCPQPTTPPLRGTQTRPRGGGFELDTEWEECGTGQFRQRLTVTAAGKLRDHGKQMVGKSNCVIGRRPEGLCVAPGARPGSQLGSFFAMRAQLEAASVFAFERLARELAALYAPATLIAAAARSALDEVRHTQAMTRLALRAGAEPRAPRVAALPLRAPFAIALENAVEGCVRESYGALVAHHQALVAGDPLVRAVMAVIAEDETRHAQLAWRVAAWLEPQLSRPQRAELHEARRTALHELSREVDMGLSADATHALGWPQPEHQVPTLDRFARVFGMS